MGDLLYKHTGRKRGASAHRAGVHASVGAGNKDLFLSNLRLAERKESRQNFGTDRQRKKYEKWNFVGRKINPF